jgi:uncharacterized tellurite resistance protein B-like protein
MSSPIAPPVNNQLIVSCPHCHINLKISNAHRSKNAKCPRCHRQFTVPKNDGLNDEGNSLSGIPLYAVVIGGHVVFAMLTLLVFKAISPIILIILIEVAFYFRKWIATKSYLLISELQARRRDSKSELQSFSSSTSSQPSSRDKEVQRPQTTTLETRSQSVRTNSPKPSHLITEKENPELVSPLINPDMNEETKPRDSSSLMNDSPDHAASVLTGSHATQSTFSNIYADQTISAEPISLRSTSPLIKPEKPVLSQSSLRLLPSLATTIRAVFRNKSSLNDLGTSLPHEVAFFGPNSVLILDRGEIESPLIYATSSAQYGSYDPSLIDGTLEVLSDHDRVIEDLPYWPNYYDATPKQRSRYLDWLYSGRQDPHIELGYVFIYFYGLERRLIVDDADHQAIVDEVLRLRPIYSHSRSFQRYTQSFLWLAFSLDAIQKKLSQATIEKILSLADRWGEEGVDRYLAYLYESGQTLQGTPAFHVAKSLEGAKNSVIVRRHEQLFQELFLKKFQEQFAMGMTLKASRRTRQLKYQPASAALARSLANNNGHIKDLPNVLGIESQFKPLIAIWDLCIEELRDYDRAHRNSGKSSASAYESLPEELRDGEHPEYESWHAFWKRADNRTAPVIVTVSELAILKGLPVRATLLKAQCQEILRTADAVGIGIEPDFRLTGKYYQWEQPVVLFHRDEIKAEDSGQYLAAATLLQLGICVALADGNQHESELSVITKQLEDRFDFDKDQSKRLEACRDLLMQHPPNPAKSIGALKKKFTEKERLVLGDYLISIAAADRIVTVAEREILRKLFQSLGIPVEILERTLQPIVAGLIAGSVKTTKATPVGGFFLNPETIARIASETEAVSAMLSEAMKIDDEEAEENQSEIGLQNVVQNNILDTASATVVQAEHISDKIPNKAIANPPQRFVAFYQELITRAEWPEWEAKELAKRHQVMINGAIEALNEWSQEHWNDWIIEEGDPLRVRLDLLRSKAS